MLRVELLQRIKENTGIVMNKNRNIVSSIYKKFTPVSNKLTNSYTETYGYPCDLYFPVHFPKRGGTYNQVNLYEPEELPTYKDEPNLTDQYFYIPNLMKYETMNSPADILDNFIMVTEGLDTIPFIETTSARELPIATKVVVKVGHSKIMFFIDKKTVINGADGHMLMRMYLSPLTKDKDGKDIRKRARKDGDI